MDDDRPSFRPSMSAEVEVKDKKYDAIISLFND